MSEFKGTPGPWDIEFNNKATKAKVSGEGWFAFARVWIRPSKVEGMANARLISAAPELLEALDIIVKLDENKVYMDAPWQEALKLARAAIAKALGEE